MRVLISIAIENGKAPAEGGPMAAHSERHHRFGAAELGRWPMAGRSSGQDPGIPGRPTHPILAGQTTSPGLTSACIVSRTPS
jgi:hypothetical protein